MNKWLWFAVAIYAVLAIFTPYDDTDPAGPFQRSGLGLYTDARTGCQYVKAGAFGGTTPRLDRDGRQICIGQQK